MGRLSRALIESNRRLQSFRDVRRSFLLEYAGTHYGQRDSLLSESGKTARQPINTIGWFVRTMLGNLAYRRRIECQVATHDPMVAPYADTLGLAWDKVANGGSLHPAQPGQPRPRGLNLISTLRTAITDALMGMGIVRTGDVYDGLIDGAGNQSLVMAIDNVDLDAFQMDPLARSVRGAQWQGHTYRVDREWLLESGLMDPAKIEGLPAYNPGQRGKGEDISAQAQAYNLSPQIELTDVYLCRERMIVTVPGGKNAAFNDSLLERPYGVDDDGPYHFLGFQWLPNNPLPIPPVAWLFDMHLLINKLATKLGRQAERAKSVLTYDKRDEGDAETVRKAADGDSLGLMNPGAAKVQNYGGTLKELYDHTAFLFENFDRIGGGMDLLSGSAAQSGTLGQDQILSQGAGINIQDMTGHVQEFADEIGRFILRSIWDDPTTQAKFSVSKSGIDIPLELNDQRIGEFNDYDLQVNLYSVLSDSPSSRFQRLQGFLNNIVLPAAGLLQATGHVPDVLPIVEQAAAMLGLETSLNMIQGGPQAPQINPAQQGQPGARPTVPGRNPQPSPAEPPGAPQ